MNNLSFSCVKIRLTISGQDVLANSQISPLFCIKIRGYSLQANGNARCPLFTCNWHNPSVFKFAQDVPERQIFFTHEKLVFLSPIKKLIHHSLLFPIQKEKLQIYLQNMSFLTRKTLLHFYVEQYKGAYHFFPPRQTLSENQSIYVMIYKMKNILEVKSHFDAFVPLFNRTLQEEHYQLSDNVFLEKTKERFDQIPVESRELIWQGFANSLYLYSFNLVVSHSVSESYVGQSIYSFTVLTLGIWNQKFQDVEGNLVFPCLSSPLSSSRSYHFQT